MDSKENTKAISEALKPVTDRLDKLEKAQAPAGQQGATGAGQNTPPAVPEEISKAIGDAINRSRTASRLWKNP